MPQQLIYTSAPRGLVPGRSGYCTVARTAAMREPLVLRLEQLSYYHHAFLTGGRERPIFACRVVDIRGARFHVLSRIQDAGLDFTGRTNFIAHHLVVTPEEIRQLPVPALILRDWPGWVMAWAQEPQMLANEDCSGLTALAGKTALPANIWQRVTGDAVNGYGLLEARSGMSFNAAELDDESVLGLLAESEELLEVRDARRDFRAAPWQYTFTTSLQEQDNPGDFRWRIFHPDSPSFARMGGADSPALASVRASRSTDEEATLARSGKKPPSFRTQPPDTEMAEGAPARLRAEADGVPAPTYQWFAVDRSEKVHPLAGENGAELVLPSPPVGVSRYKVTAINSAGESTSRVVVLSVEQRMRLQRDTRTGTTAEPPRADAPYIQSGQKIENQRNRLLAEKAEQAFNSKRKLKRAMIVISVLLIAGLIVAACFALKKKHSPVVASPNGLTNAVAESSATVSTDAQLSVTSPSALQTNPRTDSPPVLPNGGAAAADSRNSNNVPELRQMRDFKDDLAGRIAWKPMRIGNNLPTEHFSFFPKTKTMLHGMGGALGGTNDSFYYACHLASNSVDFVACLKRAGAFPASRCGVMIRDSDRVDSPFAFVGLTQSNKCWLLRSSAGTECNLTNIPGTPFPVFLRLTRVGDAFSGYFSTNKSDWIPVLTNQMIEMKKENYLLGMVICSGSADLPAIEAEFDGMSIIPLYK